MSLEKFLLYDSVSNCRKPPQQANESRLKGRLSYLRSCGGTGRLRVLCPESNNGACFGQQTKTASLCPDLAELGEARVEGDKRTRDPAPVRVSTVPPGDLIFLSEAIRKWKYSCGASRKQKPPKGGFCVNITTMLQCRLCLQNKELIKNSHIIPDFLYKDLYDEKHTMIRTEGLDVKSARKIQTGEKEGGILCRECDNEILGSLERYAHRVLYTDKEGIIAPVVLHPDGKLTSNQCDNIDYTKFKLFLLSLLWRASISRNPFFSHVDLGPLGEPIRQMLLNSDARGQMDFPCMVSSWRHDQRRMASAAISSPRRIRGENGGTRYILQIGQFLLVFFVSKNDRPDWLQDAAISPKNRMRIVHLNPENGQELLETLLGPIFVQALSTVQGV